MVSDIPEFRLHGENDPDVEARIQPKLAVRGIANLSQQERDIFLQELINNKWLGPERTIVSAMTHLNSHFLRELPAKRIHKMPYHRDRYGSDNSLERQQAAADDFCEIFSKSKNEDLILRMLSAVAKARINENSLEIAKKETDPDKRLAAVNHAYENIDRFASMLNYLFKQFAVNQRVTRSGFVPDQDDRVASQIYHPVLIALSDPRYERLNSDLSAMFSDYRNRDYADVITKAHSALQRFLQIQVGEEGKNGQRELGALFKEAQQKGVVSDSPFGSRLVTALEGFFPRERATKSTAKPSLKDTTPRDAKLMMDLVLVYIGHCLAAA